MMEDTLPLAQPAKDDQKFTVWACVHHSGGSRGPREEEAPRAERGGAPHLHAELANSAHTSSSEQQLEHLSAKCDPHLHRQHFPGDQRSQRLVLQGYLMIFPVLNQNSPVVKNPSASAGSLGQENALQKEMATHSSIPENPMDRGAWWATVHGITKSWT